MASELTGSILLSLRRITRAIDQHNKQLSDHFKLTVPQLVCLRHLELQGAGTPGELARAVFLSQATVTGIVDRLEAKGLVRRERHASDRRKQIITLTHSGHELAQNMPWPLQERFAQALAALDCNELELIDNTLQRLASMMEAPPVLQWKNEEPFSEGCDHSERPRGG